MRYAPVVFVLTSALAGCGDDTANHPDAALPIDAFDGLSPDAGDARLVDSPLASDAGLGGGPYRHTITIDGVNDFDPTTEQIATTSAGFNAYAAWDDNFVYIGYDGPDLSTTTTDASTKWLFVYLDGDPGGATGATTSEQYNTQHATFPGGFGAEYYARWKCDGTFHTLRQYVGSAWSDTANAPSAAQGGTYVEMAIPRATVAPGATLGIETYMINEQNDAEGTFAGIYTDNFTDGYGSDMVETAYLLADFTSSSAPNDFANKAQ